MELEQCSRTEANIFARHLSSSGFSIGPKLKPRSKLRQYVPYLEAQFFEKERMTALDREELRSMFENSRGSTNALDCRDEMLSAFK